MAVRKIAATTSLQIEVASGQDSSGNTVYRKKSFSNVKTDANLENVVAVANAIKDVIDAETRNILVAESSKLVEEA